MTTGYIAPDLCVIGAGSGGLAALALVPVVYKHWRVKKNA